MKTGRSYPGTEMDKQMKGREGTQEIDQTYLHTFYIIKAACPYRKVGLLTLIIGLVNQLFEKKPKLDRYFALHQNKFKWIKDIKGNKESWSEEDLSVHNTVFEAV